MKVLPQVRIVLTVLVAATPLTAGAQTGAEEAKPGETLAIAPGPQYDAGWLHRVFFGSHYRDLWTTPLEATVLDLDRFAGGLTASQRGGGEQTKSLRFEGGDGREYQFRSIDKDPVKTLPPALQTTAAVGVVRDQTSAGHPVGAVIVPRCSMRRRSLTRFRGSSFSRSTIPAWANSRRSTVDCSARSKSGPGTRRARRSAAPRRSSARPSS